MTHTKHKEIMEKVEELHDWCWRIDDTSENIEKAEEVKEQLKTLISSALTEQLEEIERWVEENNKKIGDNDVIYTAELAFYLHSKKEIIKKQ